VIRLCAKFVLGLLLAMPGLAPAATFGDLFTVSVEPDPAARDIRTDAVRRGMQTLLTRITGLRDAPQDPRLAGLIANAGSLLDSYSPVAADEIRIGFQRGRVIDELTRLGMPIWSDERPSTLLWIATDFGTGLRAELGAAPARPSAQSGPLAGAASESLPREYQAAFSDWVDSALEQADERGLPIELPRLDAEDRRFVRFADVWGGFDPLIEQAAERYGVDAILIGRIAVTEAGPEVHWILRRGDLRQSFVTTDPAAGIERLADLFAAEYTIVGGLRQTAITIHGIETWSDYGRVLQYLNSLSIVERVDVDGLSRDGDLVLRLVARGDDGQLRQVLTLGGVLALPLAESSEFPVPPLPPVSGSLEFYPAWRIAALTAEPR
jgi:hypothetical protein